MALLEVENLEVSIVTQGKLLPVVESISFEVTDELNNRTRNSCEVTFDN